MKNHCSIYAGVLALLLLPFFFSCTKERTLVPPVINISAVSEITSTTVTIVESISNSGGEAITSTGVCWSTNQNPTVIDNKTSTSAGAGSLTSSITGLLPGTTYYIRAYAISSAGIVYSSQSTLTTLALPPSSDGSYITLQKATIGRGIDLVFFGDGYTVDDISSLKYENNLRQAFTNFFAIEPYKTYSAYFNAYMVYAVSAESGISTPTTTVNTKFGTKFTKVGTSELTTNLTACTNYALKAPIKDIGNTVGILVANSSTYGGTTYIHSGSKGFNLSICPYAPNYFRGIVEHEGGGHGFGNLADEYVDNVGMIPQSEIDILNSDHNNGIFLNVDVTNNLSTILWNHFIGLANYSYVGAYEGADLYSLGVWRPESASLMINNIKYINAPGREAIVKRIMQLAGLTYSFADFQAKDVMELTAGTRSAGLIIDKSLLLPPPIRIK
jgi:hypothetical protein